MSNNLSQIIIIGAGASGLMAAHMLAGKYAVTILEARARTGGRIHTLRDQFSFPLEEGAEFIHGDQPLTHELIRLSGGDVLPVKGAFYQKWNGKQVSDEHDDDQWDQFMSALRKLDQDMSIHAFVHQYFSGEKYQDLRKSVYGFAEGYDAADVRQASALALREEWKNQDDDEQRRIKGGYSTIIRFLENEVSFNGGEIHLSTPVTKIEWFRGTVNVHTQDQQIFRSERIIVTVPLGVLNSESIVFSPSLTKHQDAFRKMGFGGVIKCFVELMPDFWEDHIQKKYRDMAFIFSDATIPTWWSQHPDNIPVLTGWLGGPQTYTMDKRSASLHEMITNSLGYLLNSDATSVKTGIRAIHISDWVSDPYSKGAYTYATVASRGRNDSLSGPVEDTIYFAGEAFYNGRAMGTVEAALSSGKQIAEQILSGKPHQADH